MGYIQLAGAILLFVFEWIRRKWVNDERKEKRYEELEKKLMAAIKDRNTVEYFNIRRELLRLREEK